mmetsp:Transcript_18919/g.38045  ORF Transcript_18919/g.38045 Transcript_18919/m.38045 type:complete len:212 (+) Transcript_18919:6323-6958(+)
MFEGILSKKERLASTASSFAWDFGVVPVSGVISIDLKFPKSGSSVSSGFTAGASGSFSESAFVSAAFTRDVVSSFSQLEVSVDLSGTSFDFSTMSVSEEAGCAVSPSTSKASFHVSSFSGEAKSALACSDSLKEECNSDPGTREGMLSKKDRLASTTSFFDCMDVCLGCSSLIAWWSSPDTSNDAASTSGAGFGIMGVGRALRLPTSTLSR